jgi:MarR family transcriptional regulator, 2-MHQ and catechol-resistance regulon repressor
LSWQRSCKSPGLLVQVVSGIGERAAERLERHGLTTVDLDVLVALGEPPEVEQPTMSDLATRTGLTPSGTTRVVDRLAGRGLVARSACATDRRITHVSLTAAGNRLLGAALPDHLSVLEETLLRPLRGPGQLASFTDQLRRLRDVLVASGEPAGAA